MKTWADHLHNAVFEPIRVYISDEVELDDQHPSSGRVEFGTPNGTSDEYRFITWESAPALLQFTNHHCCKLSCRGAAWFMYGGLK
jgi:hypothetical protein